MRVEALTAMGPVYPAVVSVFNVWVMVNVGYVASCMLSSDLSYNRVD
jgi:hypothetical protein